MNKMYVLGVVFAVLGTSSCGAPNDAPAPDPTPTTSQHEKIVEIVEGGVSCPLKTREAQICAYIGEIEDLLEYQESEMECEEDLVLTEESRSAIARGARTCASFFCTLETTAEEVNCSSDDCREELFEKFVVIFAMNFYAKKGANATEAEKILNDDF